MPAHHALRIRRQVPGRAAVLHALLCDGGERRGSTDLPVPFHQACRFQLLTSPPSEIFSLWIRPIEEFDRLFVSDHIEHTILAFSQSRIIPSLNRAISRELRKELGIVIQHTVSA